MLPWGFTEEARLKQPQRMSRGLPEVEGAEGIPGRRN